MFKNKFNLKLTLCLVSLFIGVLLIVLGNQVKVCLSFGLIFLGVAVEFFALYKIETINKAIKAINVNMMDENFNFAYEKQYKKQRNKISHDKNFVAIVFTLTAILIAALGVINFFNL